MEACDRLYLNCECGKRIVGPQLNLMLIKSDLVLCFNQAAILI